MSNPTIPTPDQQAWLKKVNQLIGVPSTSNVSFAGSTAPPVTLAFPPRNGNSVTGPSLQIDPQKLQEILKQSEEKRKKDAQQDLEQAEKWLRGLDREERKKMSYPAILAKIKEDYPAVGDLPKPKTLMDMVDKVLLDTNYLSEKRIESDPKKLAMEKLIAAYIAALPKSIKATVKGDGITLSMVDRSPAAAAAGEAEKFEFKNKNYTIDISNAAWQSLDPALRAKWKSLNDEASSLQKLKDAITSLKKDWETKKDDGTTSKLELELRIKDLEAEFKGRWDTLQESINASAKLTTDGFKATITEAKKNVTDQKVGAELELKLDEMSVGLKTFATTPDLKTALAITGSAEKITAKIEAEVIKTGTVVTLSYEKALKEVKEQLELQIKQGNTTVAVALKNEADKLEDQLKKLNSSTSKDFEAVKGLDEGLSKLRVDVKAQFSIGNFKVSAGGNVASDGAAGGQVQVDLMLKNGVGFRSKGDQKVSFAAEVTNKGYKFSLSFTIGEMPELDSVKKANEDATKQMRELYNLVSSTQIRSISDAKKIQEALTKVMDPLDKSVQAMKKADKKDFALKFGINVSGDLPSGGRMAPPVMGVGLTIVF